MDARLRELERRWREGGALEDGARWLLERSRTGELPRERLILAAHAGDAAARAALHAWGSPGPPTPPGEADGSVEEPAVWLRSLEPWGAPAVLVALVGAARVGQTGPHPPYEAHLQAALRWARCPCRDHAEAARLLTREQRQPRRWLYSFVAYHVAQATWLADERGCDGALGAGSLALRALLQAGVSAATVVEAMRAAVAGWALEGSRS